MPVDSTSSSCAGCSKPFGLFSKSYECATPPVPPGDFAPCGRRFCWDCLNHACITATEAAKALAGGLEGIGKARIESMCKSCYKKAVPLEFGSSDPAIAEGVEVFEPEAFRKNAQTTVFFAHGGGGCRLMFRPHARHFQSLGYRAVVFDFPGHGALMDEPLSIESAMRRISHVFEKYGSKGPDTADYYVGGSLGGYIGMEFLGKFPTMFKKAVITMCGQNVGVGRGMMASAGLMLMGGVSNNLSSATLLSTMRQQTLANKNLDPELLMELLRPGFFFGQNNEQIAILRNSHPAAALERYPGPVLFINGSKDFRDSEEKWLEASNKGNGGKSKLIVYEGADHFFSHDRRYMERFLSDMADFFEERG
ncbi:Alpha/Beta hydrolase protein [Hyaloraphidium curvatum]|nr:Alpha/Beta hydrolase protein [Hyaloraphidium curvatum]